MAVKKRTLSPLSVLMIITILAAIATWVMPAGRYDKLLNKGNSVFILTDQKGDHSLPFSQHILDSLHIRIRLEKFRNGSIQKAISIPDTYHAVAGIKSGVFSILQAPIKGTYDAVEIFIFLLILGGFMNVFQETGALVSGLTLFSHRMKGKENWLIIMLTFLFSFGGASYGMAEEALVFYPVITPIFIASGYDLIIPAAIIFGGTSLGNMTSFTNPFATIIASNAAGISWIDGIYERLAIFLIATSGFIFYIIRYARKIKRNPHLSHVYLVDGFIPSGEKALDNAEKTLPVRKKRDHLLMILFLSTFLVMIAGVIIWEWWFLEMSTLVLAATILIGILTRMNENHFMETFMKGAANILSVAFIVGVARGITVVLNNGNVSDTIIYYAAAMVGRFPPAIFIILVFFLFIFLTIFISSTSGMAVLTMPIIGSLAFIVGIPAREIVNAYLYGMGIMNFLTPTGLILPSLALVNVSFKAWWRFISPFLIFLTILSILFLLLGVLL